MSLEIQNDMRKIERCFEMLDHISKIKFQTEIGNEVNSTLREALNYVVRPFLLEKHKQLKKQL